MTETRRIMPLPLGGEHGLPYSRGLMARALIAVGIAPDRAYVLETGRVVLSGTSAEIRQNDAVRRSYLGY